jgi:hypothetical protein
MGNKSRPWKAIIDTGADRTFIPVAVTGQLHLKKIDDSVDVYGPDAPEGPQDEYVADLNFLGLSFPYHPVIASDKWNEILIGRDILNRYVLTLDGPNRQFTIT